MNLEIAKDRISHVAKPDSITISDGDFLATHVEMKKLQILSKFALLPNDHKFYTEEYIFKNLILNPEDRHQFIAVYGQSGTGKSHLIRWFAARYEQARSDNEVMLFIRRSDNTLKGTIRQLLEQPVVQNIKNKDIYKRLIKASMAVEENILKDLIYHNFIVEIDNDQNEHDIILTNILKRKLVAFLNNEIVHEFFMQKNGPIERMYSKIAEHYTVDRDTIAQFEKEDFLIEEDLYENIQTSGGDRKAEKLALELLSDEKGPKTAQDIADYLNQFKNDVIQRCAGIEPGDFKQIFLDIRKELHRLDKKLTLFIEDVTSFTGVDTALLDALIEEHTGKRSGEELCIISSVVGTTSNYLQKNFKDNHKDRITKYIYIPSDVLDEAGLYEFVAKYVNTMSIEDEVINKWVASNANPEDYPIHIVEEGKNWEYVDIGNDKRISIYPFTKMSILYFYNHILPQGHQTPRYIIRDIIEPIVRDVIYNRSNFPSIDIKLVNVNTTLSFRINSQIKDQNTVDRLMKFMSVWGNGTTDQYTQDGKKYIAGILEELYEDFSFPALKMDIIDPPKLEETSVIEKNEHPKIEIAYTNHSISQSKIEKVDAANKLLSKWVNEAVVDISSTVGAAGLVHAAIHDTIPEFIFTAINWQSEGISMDQARKVKDSSAKLLIAMEGQAKKRGLYELKADWKNLNLILAFIRLKEYGGGKWIYLDADFDAYLITTWVETIKKDLVKKVLEYKPGEPSNYIEAAVAAEMYRIILNGEFREKSLKHFNTQVLLASKANKVRKTSHSQEWDKLLGIMEQKNAAINNRNTVRQYFKIEQGIVKNIRLSEDKKREVVVLDHLLLSNILSRVKRNKLTVPEGKWQEDDTVTQRKEPFKLLSDIKERIKIVAQAELSLGRAMLDKIYAAFGEKEITEDEINEFITRIKKFYGEANKTQINIKEYSVDEIKKFASLEKAINDINDLQEDDDPLTIIMAFSCDPVTTIRPLFDLIENMGNEVAKANKIIAQKSLCFETLDDGMKGENLYFLEMQSSINKSKAKLERLVNI